MTTCCPTVTNVGPGVQRIGEGEGTTMVIPPPAPLGVGDGVAAVEGLGVNRTIASADPPEPPEALQWARTTLRTATANKLRV